MGRTWNVGSTDPVCMYPYKREVGNLNVIPQPQEVVQNFQENPFVIHSGTKIVYPAGNEKLERTAEFWLLI